MSTVVRLSANGWTSPIPPDVAAGAAAALERGDLLFFEHLSFPIEDADQANFSPHILSSKNISFDPSSGKVGGTSLAGVDLERLRSMMNRFSSLAAAFAAELLPKYRGRLEQARSSFRPAEIQGRSTTWRKDDSRLHIDNFPATPVHGKRILRIFTNVNPAGRPRSWRIGEDFEHVATRFKDGLTMPWPGSAAVLKALQVTKTRRSDYDALMQRLHDCMKGDMEYQRSAPQTAIDFPAGSTWVAFTDYLSHAAMAGQYQLEQTFLLPVAAMIDESRAPLRILERIKGRALI
jgi:hypothetical protein